MGSCRYFFLQCSERENMLDGKKEEQVWLVKLIYYTWGCCYTTQHLHKMSPFVIHPEKKKSHYIYSFASALSLNVFHQLIT